MARSALRVKISGVCQRQFEEQSLGLLDRIDPRLVIWHGDVLEGTEHHDEGFLLTETGQEAGGRTAVARTCQIG